MPNRSSLAADWFRYGDEDFQAAQSLITQGGPARVVLTLVQQSAEKYLKGYLIYHGWKLKKTHDLVSLINEALVYDSTFRDYVEMADRLSAYYFDSRYPAGSPIEYPPEQITAMTSQTEKLIAKIKADVTTG